MFADLVGVCYSDNLLIITSMPQLTKEHFDKIVDGLAGKDELRDLDFRLRDMLAVATRRFDSIDSRLGVIDERLDRIETRLEQHEVKLEAIMSMGVARQEVRNLVHELKLRGRELDETKIFVSRI